ncbi:hypothetical protein AVEN_224829-1 [Araneus ventricosus]|uniref:C2H2-type domain-containing protein n=1 Tax=Araneus ventricosus TaxID=182803 RepID=A0A4Y2VN87_ARAVE|nr:hypothetical protein AVEN_224829-1 [Araneus ventricosus]
MYHPSNGMPRTPNTWGYIAVHEKQEANRAATASHGELPRLPSREGRKKQKLKKGINSKGEKALGYLGVVNPVTPEEAVSASEVSLLSVAESIGSTSGETSNSFSPRHETQVRQNHTNSKITHKCGPCSFQTQNFNAFNWHINKFHKGKYFLQCVNCNKNLYSKGSYRIHVNNCKNKPAQDLPHLENETLLDLVPTTNNSGRGDHKSIDIMTDLCIELEGKHRAPKVLIDSVVSKVQDLLEVCGSDLSLNQISSNYLRKRHYTKLGVYVKPEECLLGNEHSVKKGYFIPFKKLLSNLLQSPEYSKYFCEPYRGEGKVENGVLCDFLVA